MLWDVRKESVREKNREDESLVPFEVPKLEAGNETRWSPRRGACSDSHPANHKLSLRSSAGCAQGAKEKVGSREVTGARSQRDSRATVRVGSGLRPLGHRHGAEQMGVPPSQYPPPC